ncbi:MAG TPA: lysophospholipid acyltransferase family protein [Thermoanaerobaculia bacterium]|nr:lysophospholipid acyltransferase family protein [Thermoanaerobaculia bacterium]
MIRSAILARLAGIWIALLRRTIRVERLHYERYTELKARGAPILFSLWHGRMFLPIVAHRHQGIVTMASQSEDGQIITLWLKRIGYSVVRGSTTRGGGEALRQMVRQVRSGRAAALTVDGPKGPSRVPQAGVVQLARLTGGSIIPITFSSCRPRFFRSWDRYLLPKLFSRNILAYGESFTVPPEMTDEAALAKVAQTLDAATREADEAAGIVPPPEAAAAPPEEKREM